MFPIEKHESIIAVSCWSSSSPARDTGRERMAGLKRALARLATKEAPKRIGSCACLPDAAFRAGHTAANARKTAPRKMSDQITVLSGPKRYVQRAAVGTSN